LKYRLWHFPIDIYLAIMIAYFVLRVSTGYSLWPIVLMSDFLHLVLPLVIPLLVLVIVTRQKWRTVIASLIAVGWIALYGVPLMGRFVPKQACEGCESVVVMTHNVGAGLVEAVPLAAYLRNSGADVIGLQELTPYHAAVLQSQISDVYPYQVYSNDRVQLGLLSKYPIEEMIENYGPLENDAKYLQIAVNVNGKRLNVVTTRLKPPRLGGYYLKGFGYWIWPTADDLVHIASEYAPVVVLIDMNATNQSENFAKLAHSGLRDAYQEAGSGYGPGFPARTNGYYALPAFTPPLLRIDYVLVSEGIIVVNAANGSGSGSDHLPVLAELKLP
jgi:endonuclease/exonuclease/phosphatase family metal-dependent hydrolase